MKYAVLLILLLAFPASAEGLYGAATFTWTPASGPVHTYAIFVLRDEGWSIVPEQLVRKAKATVTGFYGQTIVVRVTARDVAGSQGPVSPESDQFLFAKAEEPLEWCPAWMATDAEGNVRLRCGEE